MADARLFAKLDLGYFDNPKVADFVDDHPRVIFLHQRAILYSRQHLTDGEFPIRLVCRMVSASYCGSECDSECDYCRAVGAGLLERIDTRTGLVHDYLEHQDSADSVQRRASAGKKGAAARWSGSDANRIANGNTVGTGNGKAGTNAEERRGEESRAEQSERPRADVAALCEHLIQRIAGNGSKPPAATKAWHNEARLMLDRDKRPVDEAHRLIDWCQDSDFWRSNVMSMATFRKKYDTLRLQSQSQTEPQPPAYKTPEQIIAERGF